jgi:hypothetical protein
MEIEQLNLKLAIIESSLDNGLTFQLLNDIHGSISSGLLSNKLIANSPLSDTVLISLISHYPLSHGNFKNVMQQNMPVSKNVEQYLFDCLNKLPQGIVNQLRLLQAYNPIVATIASIQNDLNLIQLDRNNYLNELIMRLIDSTHQRKSDAIALLEKESNAITNQILGGTYISDEDFLKAVSKLNLFDNNNDNLADWLQLNRILLELHINGNTLEDLNNSEINFIRQMAWKCPTLKGMQMPNPFYYIYLTKKCLSVLYLRINL